MARAGEEGGNQALRGSGLPFVWPRRDREGVVPTGGTPAYFDKRVRDEYAKWLAVVERARIKLAAE